MLISTIIVSRKERFLMSKKINSPNTQKGVISSPYTHGDIHSKKKELPKSKSFWTKIKQFLGFSKKNKTGE